MKNEEVIFTISVSKETAEFIANVKTYENLKSKFKNGRPLVDEEDIIKAAINSFIKDIRNFYKHQIIIDSTGGLGKPYKLKNRFKEIVKARGIKQLDLSELTRIDRSNISMIFNNRNQPSIDYFLRLWIALDYPPIEEVFYREL